MTDRFLFADEAGCFTFNRSPNVSKYFIICSVIMDDVAAGHALQLLRHKLIWRGVDVRDYFHATVDSQEVRDAVFATMLEFDFSVQTTICEKSKAQPQVKQSKARFYKYPWFYHFKHGIGQHLDDGDRLLVTAASIGTKKERLTFTNSLSDVMRQNLAPGSWAVDFRPAQADTCLQIADYCAWAIQRKWERSDSRSYDLIKDRITYEYDLWKHGAKHYY